MSDSEIPCVCGHHSHGYRGHCEHMCCDTDDCECGGYEPETNEWKLKAPAFFSVFWSPSLRQKNVLR